MRCPYCDTPLTEDSPGCHSCGLSIEKADSFFGAAPHLDEAVTDLSGALSNSKMQAIRAASREFSIHFPQCHADTVVAALSPQLPLTAWAWWVFNRGRPRDALALGGKNRDVLLVIETSTRTACLTIGYGLEPFVSRETLTAALDSGKECLERGAWHMAAVTILAALRDTLGKILDGIPQTYGAPEKTWPGDAAIAPATPRPDSAPVGAGY